VRALKAARTLRAETAVATSEGIADAVAIASAASGA
jgi:hypothetical protein